MPFSEKIVEIINTFVFDVIDALSGLFSSLFVSMINIFRVLPRS